MFDNGVYLEESERLIPWGITAEEAVAIGAPRVERDDPRVDILWGPEPVFGGLDATVHAVLYGAQKLQFLDIVPTWSHKPYRLHAHYTHTRDRLIAALGRPDEVNENTFTSMPSYAWNRDGNLRLSLWLFDRFGEQLKLHVGFPDKRR